MAKLTWDQLGEKLYEAGVEKCALFVWDSEQNKYANGVAWNGITSIQESPDGAEPSDFYADNIKYATLRSAETFGATIEAYTYPDEFMECDGTATVQPGVYLGQQTRKSFGLAYVTKIGNDTDGQDHGYKIHLVYGATASPSDKSYETINDSPDLQAFSWEVTTTPVEVTGYKQTSTIVIDSTKVDKEKLAAFEKTLFGDTSVEPTLPMPDAVIAAFA